MNRVSRESSYRRTWRERDGVASARAGSVGWFLQFPRSCFAFFVFFLLVFPLQEDSKRVTNLHDHHTQRRRKFSRPKVTCLPEIRRAHEHLPSLREVKEPHRRGISSCNPLFPLYPRVSNYSLNRHPCISLTPHASLSKEETAEGRDRGQFSLARATRAGDEERARVRLAVRLRLGRCVYR